MKVWQAGSHLSAERGGKVDDWSWRQTRRRLATMVGLARPYPVRTAGAIVSLFAFTIVALIPPLLAKAAVDQGIKTGNLERLAWIVAAFVVIGLVAFGLSSLQTYLTGWVGERALADLRIRLFTHLQRLSLGYFERNRTGAIVSRITNDVEALDTLLTDGVTSLVQNLMLLVGTAVVLFVLDWRLALATLAVIPVMALLTAWFRIRSNRAYRRVRERIGLVTATLAEDISGMRVVQSYAREPRNQTSFRGINTRYRDANYETIVLNGLYFPAVDFLASLATAIVLGFGGYLLLHDEISTGTLLAFFLYLANFFDPVQQLSQLYNTFLSATAALDKINEVLDEEPEIVDDEDAVELPRIDGHVRFEGVRFGYGSLPEVLHGIDLDVPAGTTVALVGQTGAGKSTIAKLIARFYDVREGRITIDGRDVREVEQKSLRRQLGVVPQEGFLFAGTVAENIAFARPDAAREDVERAAAAVGADGWIRELEQGYDTELGERGFRLSLGQRQLIAFARALLADPRILILDEATSSVDIGTERMIEGALQRLLAGPDGVRDRASPLHDPGRRPDRRPRPRADRRAGDARGADGARRCIHEPLRRLGRAGGLAARSGAHHVLWARTPPSTTRLAPVIQRAPSEARKSTASATSSGWPRRCSGAAACQRATPSGQSRSSPAHVDQAGRDAVDPDALRPELERRGPGVHDHGRLRRGVVAVVEGGLKTLDRADVDDCAALPGPRHHSGGLTCHRDHAAHVDAQHLGRLVGVDGGKRRDGLDAGVVDENVEPPERL